MFWNSVGDLIKNEIWMSWDTYICFHGIFKFGNGLYMSLFGRATEWLQEYEEPDSRGWDWHFWVLRCICKLEKHSHCILKWQGVLGAVLLPILTGLLLTVRVWLLSKVWYPQKAFSAQRWWSPCGIRWTFLRILLLDLGAYGSVSGQVWWKAGLVLALNPLLELAPPVQPLLKRKGLLQSCSTNHETFPCLEAGKPVINGK